MADLWTPELIRDVALIATMLLLVVISVRLQAKQRQLQKNFSQLQQRLTITTLYLNALASGSAAATIHLGKVEQQFRRLAERQDRLELKDSVTQSYEHAITLVRRGATPEELVLRCGLVRDEAELLARMYQLDKAG